jgi:hypothetical protein
VEEDNLAMPPALSFFLRQCHSRQQKIQLFLPNLVVLIQSRMLNEMIKELFKLVMMGFDCWLPMRLEIL